ncbi:MAG TPA: cytochrome B [Oxalobacteraceae bacterium]|jgi:cytochrome b561|nr:cytochrome B [Oxalobacteraceae bacterium]
MTWKNSETKYGSASVGLHWLMLLLIAAVYAYMEFREIFPKGSALREGMKTWHYMLGLAVLGLVWLRLAVQLAGGTPCIKPQSPRWQMLFAGLMKIALYVFMIGTPLLGWMLLSAEAKPIPFFGLELPSLMSENKEFAKQLKELHETVSAVGYFLIGLHAAAAMYHHYVVGDNTLRRMLPFQK